MVEGNQQEGVLDDSARESKGDDANNESTRDMEMGTQVSDEEYSYEFNDPPKESAIDVDENLHVVEDLTSYPGETLEEKIDSFIATHSVAMISKSFCAFCRDVKALLGTQIGVKVHII